MLPSLLIPPPSQVRSRPRGLWKGRGTPKHSQTFDSHHDLRSPKRHRSEDTSDGGSDDDGYYIVEYSPEPSGSVCSDMDTSEPTPETKTRWDDWEDLKEMFARAAEQYESGCALWLAASVSCSLQATT
jgi:hypothetical protein